MHQTANALQKEIFLAAEGDAWLARNRERIGQVKRDSSDPVLRSIEDVRLFPKDVLEIGCSSGWRLDVLSKIYGCRVSGIDPSQTAIAEGSSCYPGLNLVRGTADTLPFSDGQFDLVIYGFCLYLCDRSDLFRIVAEGDRVVADKGYLLIYDFHVQHPHRRVYHHDPRLFSFKMDYAGLFLSHASYRLVSRRIFGASEPASEDNSIGVCLAQKDLDGAFPLRTD